MQGISVKLRMSPELYWRIKRHADSRNISFAAAMRSLCSTSLGPFEGEELEAYQRGLVEVDSVAEPA